jgi:hypothetical protein
MIKYNAHKTKFNDIIKDISVRESEHRIDYYIKLKNHKYLDYSECWSGGPNGDFNCVRLSPYINENGVELSELFGEDYDRYLEHKDYFMLELMFPEKDGYNETIVTPLKYEYCFTQIKDQDFNITPQKVRITE